MSMVWVGFVEALSLELNMEEVIDSDKCETLLSRAY